MKRVHRRSMIKHISAFAIFALLLVAVLLSDQERNQPPRSTFPPAFDSPLVAVRPVRETPQSEKDFGHLPTYFELNQGQTDPQVKFIARSGGATTFLTASEAVFLLPIANWRLPIEDSNGERPSNELNLGFQTLDTSLLLRPSRMRNLKSAIEDRQSTMRMKLVGANP